VQSENNEHLGFYRLSHHVHIPTYATPGSAAFDLRAFFDGTAVKTYTDENIMTLTELDPQNHLYLLPSHRYMIPTGLILDIPEGYRVDVNMRGGTALKKGLALTNDTGIIDWDYVQELYILVTNTTNTVVTVENDERIAQAKLEKVIPVHLFEDHTPPSQKTSRNGGFSSTGIF
jgi:dUTP pyrophosphatase